MLVQCIHSIAMFAAYALRDQIYMHIAGVRIIGAYNIDDLFHTRRIDPPGMEKVVFIVCTCKLNNNYYNSQQ